ncbi:hypothetical protein RIF29_33375 [Crotalaria pallida]|uniref:Uncharacterized protein n=1 Tax=Crotalaria pallida TaxID=3830 RepID=A0AAN9E827_CROPI
MTSQVGQWEVNCEGWVCDGEAKVEVTDPEQIVCGSVVDALLDPFALRDRAQGGPSTYHQGQPWVRQKGIDYGFEEEEEEQEEGLKDEEHDMIMEVDEEAEIRHVLEEDSEAKLEKELEDDEAAMEGATE